MQGHSRNGSFDTLRLVAALLVFHSHSFALAGMPEPSVPGYSWGGLAVIVFFTMSGYWVSRSALERSLVSYASSRFLRITPGLLVCCLVTIAGCALATSEVINDYFRLPDTWRFLQNAFPFWLPQVTRLPGVFEDGPFHDPNGSLWTLPYEVGCYVLAAMAAVFGPKGMRAAMVGAAVFALAVVFGTQNEIIRLLCALDRRWMAIYAAAFFFGASLNGTKDRDLLKLMALGLVAVVISRHDPAVASLSGIVLYGSTAIWIGRNLNLDRVVTRGQDISYGVYIYAFPCEQLAVRHFEPHHAPAFAAYYATALAATLVLAALSWVLVERPALNAKGRLAGVIERGVGRLPLGAIRLRPAGEA